MAFKYKARDPAVLEKRASAQAGSFQGFFADEFKVYKIKSGDNFVRFMPPTWDDPEHYGMDLYIHYQVGPERAQVLCPWKMKHQKCPLCDAQQRMERTGDEEGAKELRPGRAVAVWIIDRKEEEAGPQLWAVPFGLDKDICKISKDPQTGEIYAIDHPTEGYDVSFEKEGEKINTKYKGAQLARRASSVNADYIEWVELYPVPSTLVWRDYDAIKALYEGAGALADDDKPATPTPRPRGNAATDTPARGAMADDPTLADEAELDKPAEPPAPRPRGNANTAATPAASGLSRAEELRARFAGRK